MSESLRAARPSDERMFAALLVQPIVAGALTFVLFPILFVDRSGRLIAGGYVNVNDAALSVAIGAAFVTAIVALLAVLPTALWVTKRQQLTMQRTVLFGFGFGNVTYLFLAVLLARGRFYGSEGVLGGLVLSSILGVAGAAVFWVIALRPQRQA